MTDDLLELAIATIGGRELWKTLRGLRVDISPFLFTYPSLVAREIEPWHQDTERCSRVVCAQPH